MSEDPVDLDEIRSFNGRSPFLDRDGQPMTLRQWADAFEDWEQRLVARTTVGDAEVLTVWMGVDNDPIDNPVPLIFGSIIRHGATFGEESESATETDAINAHRALVEQLTRKGSTMSTDSNEPDGDIEIQLNKDRHQCLGCDAPVTAVSMAGVNRPCGCSAGTLIRRPTGGED